MKRQKVVALAGGTGSAKLLRGLVRLPLDLTVVANVGDNFWAYGAYVCPDLDVACYTLAGIADPKRGWGIAGDTFHVLGALAAVGEPTWFRLGDRDLATCLARTRSLRAGATLTESTRALASSLGVRVPVLPVTDDTMETRVVTDRGEMHLQEFWVRERGEPGVSKVWYKGARRARLSREAASAIASADRVVVCPANPVSSIGPMLAVPGLRKALVKCRRAVALSPMEGAGSISGPAGKMMKGTGKRADSVGVARAYSEFLDVLAISEKDDGMKAAVERLGVKCVLLGTRMGSPADALRVAKEMVRI